MYRLLWIPILLFIWILDSSWRNGTEGFVFNVAVIVVLWWWMRRLKRRSDAKKEASTSDT